MNCRNGRNAGTDEGGDRERKHQVVEAVKERLIDEVKNRAEAAVEESERR